MGKEWLSAYFGGKWWGRALSVEELTNDLDQNGRCPERLHIAWWTHFSCPGLSLDFLDPEISADLALAHWGLLPTLARVVTELSGTETTLWFDFLAA